MKKNKIYKLIPMLGLLGFAPGVAYLISGCSCGDSQQITKDKPIPQEALIINASGVLQGFKTKLLTDDMNVLVMPNSANDIRITSVSLPVFRNIHKLYVESQSLTSYPQLNQNNITYSQLFPSLELLDMSNRTDSISSWNAFNNMPNLTHLKIGNIANFNGYTFTNCPALNDIEIANGVTSITKIDNVENDNIVGQIVVPSGGLTAATYNSPTNGALGWGRIKLSEPGILATSVTTTLGDNVFSGANISSIDFSGTSITSLGSSAFLGSGIKHVINWSSVTVLGYSTFSYSSFLESLDLSNVTSLGGSTFSNCNSLDTIDFGATNQRTIIGFTSNSFDGISPRGHIKGTDAQNWLAYLKSVASTVFAAWQVQ